MGDLTDPAETARVVAEVEPTLGSLDILVHNAGGDIEAAGGKPDPNDAVFIKPEDVRAVLDEVARAVEFLAGPLGDFVSGEVVRVHGGAYS